MLDCVQLLRLQPLQCSQQLLQLPVGSWCLTLLVCCHWRCCRCCWRCWWCWRCWPCGSRGPEEVSNSASPAIRRTCCVLWLLLRISTPSLHCCWCLQPRALGLWVSARRWHVSTTHISVTTRSSLHCASGGLLVVARRQRQQLPHQRHSIMWWLRLPRLRGTV